jgi:predicted ArsR family transcriptional regulator
MRWWERQIGGKTRGRIIALLRRKERTVKEVASDLGVTENAARLQLQLLEREGVVRESGTRPHDGAGKPASLFAVAPGAEASLSAAYAPVLVALLASMSDKLDRAQMDDLLRDAGRRLAPIDLKKATPDARVRVAAPCAWRRA